MKRIAVKHAGAPAGPAPYREAAAGDPVKRTLAMTAVLMLLASGALAQGGINSRTACAGCSTPACPASTPTQNRSWGSLKSLYR